MGENKYVSYGKEQAMSRLKHTPSLKETIREARRNGYKTVREWEEERKANSKANK